MPWRALLLLFSQLLSKQKKIILKKCERKKGRNLLKEIEVVSEFRQLVKRNFQHDEKYRSSDFA